ncbi:MAG TPA: hypothetical protein VGR43_01040, partial [Dehalococcoidia bacterium]|nr:hypothetical protein [Dehalococcoidia bacterium]
MAAWLALAAPAQGAPNSVQIEPAAASVQAGGTVTVSLVAEAPSAGLDGWEIDVQYDNALLNAAACASHPKGLCDKDFSSGTVRSSGNPDETLTGQLTLAAISFQATGPAGQCSSLTVQAVTFVDPEDAATSPVVNDGEICIQETVAATPTPGLTAAPSPTPISE